MPHQTNTEHTTERAPPNRKEEKSLLRLVWSKEPTRRLSNAEFRRARGRSDGTAYGGQVGWSKHTSQQSGPDWRLGFWAETTEEEDEEDDDDDDDDGFPIRPSPIAPVNENALSLPQPHPLSLLI